MPIKFQSDFEHLTSDIEKSRFLAALEMTREGARNDRGNQTRKCERGENQKMPVNFQSDIGCLTSDIEKSRFLAALEMTREGCSK